MDLQTNEEAGLLTTLVDLPRGLTEAEADVFLQTGELPDFTSPPLSVSEDTDVEGPGFTPDEALAFLAGYPLLAAGGPSAPGELIFKFDPNQRRDSHGRWTDTGGGDSARWENALTGAGALEAAPLSIGNVRSELECRPETLAICADAHGKKIGGAAREYRSTSYQDINNLLRHGFTDDFDEEDVRGWISDLDDGMRTSQLTSDVVTLRGTSTGRGIFGDALDTDDLTGYEWEEKAFVSTTIDTNIADHFGEGLLMNVRVPAGIGALQLSRASSDGRRDEGELLLERGLRMRVVGDRGRDRMGRRIIDVEVVK